MTTSRSVGTRHGSDPADGAIAAIAGISASACVILQAHPAAAAALVLATPIAALLVFGQCATRGAVMATIVSALGVAMLAGGQATDPLAAIALIGLVNVAALAGGRMARHMTPEGLADGLIVWRRTTIEAHYSGIAAPLVAAPVSRPEVERAGRVAFNRPA